jgi:hypothetical protein
MKDSRFRSHSIHVETLHVTSLHVTSLHVTSLRGLIPFLYEDAYNLPGLGRLCTRNAPGFQPEGIICSLT